MASKRKYGYYIKGNKIALIEEGTGSGICSLSGYSSQTTCEDAGGTWTENAISTNDGEYRSPVATVSDGLEIQYAYSPQYAYPSGYSATSKIFVNAWIIQDGYLAFVQDVGTSSDNTVSVGFPWAGWAGVSTPTSDTYILIQNSNRWNGIHKVQSYANAVSDGAINSIQTYTKVSKSDYGYWTGTPNFSNSNAKIANIPENRFSLNDYIWISGTVAGNRGLYRIDEITKLTTSGMEGFESFTGLTKYLRKGLPISPYHINEVTQSATVTSAGDVDEEASFSDDTDGTVHINQAFFENNSTYLIHDIDVLKDETFELDISRYQANAVVYYLKAKLAEDGGDMEMREFFMREFKRQLEKSTSALKRGPYMVQGFKEMR